MLSYIIAYLIFSTLFCVFVGRTAKFMRDGHYDDNPQDDQEQIEWLLAQRSR